MTIGVGGSSVEAELAAIRNMRGDVPPIGVDERLRRIARAQAIMREKGIDATLAAHRLDAIVAPTQGPAGLIDLVNGDPGGGGSFTAPAAVAGYPHVTVPMGFSHGLPVGLSFVGTAWSEPALLKLAYAFEQAAPARQAPSFVSTAPVGDTRRGA